MTGRDSAGDHRRRDWLACDRQVLEFNGDTDSRGAGSDRGGTRVRHRFVAQHRGQRAFSLTEVSRARGNARDRAAAVIISAPFVHRPRNGHISFHLPGKKGRRSVCGTRDVGVHSLRRIVLLRILRLLSGRNSCLLFPGSKSCRSRTMENNTSHHARWCLPSSCVPSSTRDIRSWTKSAH